MSILRPSSSQMTRRLIVLATVVFAIAISQVQVFMGWGQTAQEFSADSDTTLKVAGYDFRRELGLIVDPAWAALPDVEPRLAHARDTVNTIAADWRRTRVDVAA